MNKKQLITMWSGTILVSLIWLEGLSSEIRTYIPLVVVMTVVLILSLSDKNYIKVKEIFNSVKDNVMSQKKSKDEQDNKKISKMEIRNQTEK
ncbi:MAG: hypothetical protein WDA68_08710 [Phycisphaerae bacterium]